MATAPQINYTNRDFTKLRADLISYVKNYHADKFMYFNDASPDMMYLELLAYMGDTLNFQIDRSFNEGFRESAQSTESLVRIANDHGFYNYFAKPATTQAVLEIRVPAVPNTDGSLMVPDPRYLIGLYDGLKVEATNGAIYECLEEISFASSDRRTIVPNFDSNNQLIDFTVSKAITVIAGETRIQRFYVNSQNVKPFLEIILDDLEVTEVTGVVSVPGNTFTVPDDSVFRDQTRTYVEAEHLAQDKMFVDINPVPPSLQNLVNAYTDMTINYGEWVNKPKRFIVRKDQFNKTRLIFGSTLVDYGQWNQLIGSTNVGTLTNFSLSQVLNNSALGEVPPIDSTLFIKFRSGAGLKTSALANEIDTIIDKQFFPPSSASDFSVLDRVRSSLKISSSLPAVGGTDAMTNEEIRHSVANVFAAQDRVVTYEDAKAMVLKMPARYGQPFRISYEEIKPKVMNYTQVQTYVNQKLTELLSLTLQTDRINKVSEMNLFLQNLPTQTATILQNGQVVTLGTSSDAVLGNTPSLWLGEKCRLYVLGLDQDNLPTTLYKANDGTWQSKNTILKENIKNFLKEKRVIGDWIDIVDCNVVNIQVEFRIMADKKNKQKVLIDCLTRLRDYFDVYSWQINQPILIANVSTVLQEIDGVINVVDLKFYNIFGTDIESNKEYSPVEIGRYFNNKPNAVNTSNNKFEMNSVNNVILSRPDTFLHVKYPDLDLKGFTI